MEKIIIIIENSWNEHISSWAAETALGLESGIDGKLEFLEEIKEKLSKEFEKL